MFDFIIVNPALSISLISLILSLYNFLYSIFIRKKKITIDLLCYEVDETKTRFYYTFKTIIQNNSQLPISITDIKFNNISCVNTSDYIIQTVTRSNGNVIEENYYSVKLPINLPCLVSANELIRVETKDELDIDNLSITLYTNRGKIGKCKILLHEDFSIVDSVV